MLFYFKSRDHWSEPAGVIVIEDCVVEVETSLLESTFGIILKFGGGENVYSQFKINPLILLSNSHTSNNICKRFECSEVLL